jgi:competence ComEA-like helix-hairpin-helix protein
MKHLLLLLTFSSSLAAAPLQEIRNCTLVPTDWADGDSFRIRTPKGDEYTIRLYGADSIESDVRDTTDARRLRAQRRYFGISDHGGSAQNSIAAAKRFGDLATKRRIELLKEPFTVYTAFADGRGSAKFRRYYGFVTTSDGRDLASILVSEGLARAYGVYRQSPEGLPADDYREELADMELLASRRNRGVWKLTDWEALPAERRAEREEAAALEAAIDGSATLVEASIHLNESSRDELMRLPGIGETKALAIIEMRPFTQIDQLEKVPGIGPKTLKRLRPFLTLGD